MTLPGFDVIFDNYFKVVECDTKRVRPHRPFRLENDDMHHLLEAYALADKAIDERVFLETSGWGRQVGASAVAIALLVADSGVRVVNKEANITKNVARRVLDAFPNERPIVKNHFGAYKHPKLWSMSSLKDDMLRQKPSLVIFDSDSMWASHIQEEARDLHDILKCGVLMFKSKLR